MSRVLKRRWHSNVSGSGLPRREARPCDHKAYVPDPIVDRRITLDADVAADVADAETAITRLNVEAHALVDTEALAHILLRAEAVASSHIEGLVIEAWLLLYAEVAHNIPNPSRDVTVHEVLTSSRTYASSPTTIPFWPSPRQQLHMPSSRPSTPSWMATTGRDVHLST